MRAGGFIGGLVAALLLVCLTAPASGGQASSPRGPAAVAEQELRKLVESVPGGIPGDADLGEPFAEFFVRLDRLREYQSSMNPRSLLSGGDKLIFPASSPGSGGRMEVRSSVVVKETDSGWKFVHSEHPLAKTLSQTRTSQAPGERRGMIFAVRVPALNIYLVGREEGGKLLLAEVNEKLETGVFRPAEEVFSRLVPSAKALDARRPGGS
jgi:hypothetical protein